MIKILTGQLIADEGESIILVQKSPNLSSSELEKTGLVSDTSGFYEKISLYDNLLFYSKFYNISRSRVDDLLKRVELYEDFSWIKSLNPILTLLIWIILLLSLNITTIRKKKFS